MECTTFYRVDVSLQCYTTFYTYFMRIFNVNNSLCCALCCFDYWVIDYFCGVHLNRLLTNKIFREYRIHLHTSIGLLWAAHDGPILRPQRGPTMRAQRGPTLRALHWLDVHAFWGPLVVPAVGPMWQIYWLSGGPMWGGYLGRCKQLA